MKRFTALRVTDDGPARLTELGLEELTPGEVTLRVEYSSLNYKDALAVTGRGKILRRRPLNPGIDAAGVVLDSTSSYVRPGDHALITGCGLGEEHDGGFGGVVRMPSDAVLALPKGLGSREAMALGTAGFTAALALHRMANNGQTPAHGPILVTGASGGVGSFATQIFAQAGYEVHAASGKPELEPYLKSLGASEVIPTEALGLGQRPLERTRWGGAVDTIGGETLARLLAHVAPWGNVAAVGLAGGPTLASSVMPFILRGVSLLGISSTNAEIRTRLQIWQRLAGPWRPRRLNELVTRTIPLAAVPQAADDMLARRTHGRILVQHGGTP